MKRDFFISYTSADTFWAKKIARILEANGYSVLYQERDSKSGGSVIGFIEKGLNAWSVIAVCSEAYFRSRYCEKEYFDAVKLHIETEIRDFYTVYVQDVDKSKIPRVLSNYTRTKLFDLKDESEQEQTLLYAINHPSSSTKTNPSFPLRKLSIDIRTYENQKRNGLSPEGLCQFLLTKAAKDYQEQGRYREAEECWVAISKWCRNQRPPQENSAYMCDESAFTCRQLAIYQRADLEIDVERIPEVDAFKRLLGELGEQALGDGDIKLAIYCKRLDAILCGAEAREYPDDIKRANDLKEGVRWLEDSIRALERNLLLPTAGIPKKTYCYLRNEYLKRARSV